METVDYDVDEEVSTDSSLSDKPKRNKKYKPGKCHVCGRVFSDHRSIYVHMRIHTGEKPFECDVCGRGFNQRSNMIRHVRSHNKERPFYCEVCDKYFAFQSKQYFDQHVRSHSGERPFACKLCDKSYSFRASYVAHMRAHENKKIFVCNICHSGFSCEGRLNKHKLIHDPDQKVYMCELCKRVFSKKSVRDSHLEGSHNVLIAYECRVCHIRYSDQKSLSLHSKQHHTEVNTSSSPSNKKERCCSVPKQENSNKSSFCTTQNSDLSSISENKPKEMVGSLESEVDCVSNVSKIDKEDTNVSSVKQFITQEKLDLLLGNDLSKPKFICGVCHEEFSSIEGINQHLSTHIDDENLFVCSACKEDFSSDAELKRHISEIHPS